MQHNIQNGITSIAKQVNKNKGTGAGGANTNFHGKQFEDKTNNYHRLLLNGFNICKTTATASKFDFHLSKQNDDKCVAFVLQNGFKSYMKRTYGISNDRLFRCPDEAYIIEYANGRKVVKILEKKEQKVGGSVETKLWAAPALKREYQLALGPNFEVHYGLCVSAYLQHLFVSSDNKKYTLLGQILKENNIGILFGDDDGYFAELDSWIYA